MRRFKNPASGRAGTFWQQAIFFGRCHALTAAIIAAIPWQNAAIAVQTAAQ